jgi:hypothetical protein
MRLAVFFHAFRKEPVGVDDDIQVLTAHKWLGKFEQPIDEMRVRVLLVAKVEFLTCKEQLLAHFVEGGRIADRVVIEVLCKVHASYSQAGTWTVLGFNHVTHHLVKMVQHLGCPHLVFSQILKLARRNHVRNQMHARIFVKLEYELFLRSTDDSLGVHMISL